MICRVRVGPPPDGGGYQGSGIRSRRRKPAEMIRRVCRVRCLAAAATKALKPVAAGVSRRK